MIFGQAGMQGQSSVGAASGVARLDQLSERVLQLARPLRFEVARSAGQVEAAMRLRFRTAVAKGWITPGASSSGRERDEYDDVALQIVVLDDDTVVGTSRLVLPADGRRLPTEAAFEWKADGQTVDVSRICLEQQYRDGSHLAFLGLLSAGWQETRKHGFSQCCGKFSLKIMQLYQGLGFRVDRVGPPRPYWGEERWPILIRPQEADARLDEIIRSLENRIAK